MAQPVNIQGVLGPGQSGVSAEENTGPGYEGGGSLAWRTARPFDAAEYPNELGPRKWTTGKPVPDSGGTGAPISAETWAEYRSKALAITGGSPRGFWDDFVPLAPVEDYPQPPYLYAGYNPAPQGFSHWFSGKTVTVQENGNPIPTGATATFDDGEAYWEGDGYFIIWGAEDKVISGGSGYDPANPPQVCAVLRIGGNVIGSVCATATVWNGEVTGVVDDEWGAEGFIATDVFDDFPWVQVVVDPPPAGGGNAREITDISPTGHTHLIGRDTGRALSMVRVFGPSHAGVYACRSPGGETGPGFLPPHNIQLNWLNDPLAVPELDNAEAFEGRLVEYWTGAWFTGHSGIPQLEPFDLSNPTWQGAAWLALQSEYDYSLDLISLEEVDWPGGWVVNWQLETHPSNGSGNPPFVDAIYAGSWPSNQWWVPYGVFIPAQPAYGPGTGPYGAFRMTADIKGGGSYAGLPRTNEPTSGQPVAPVANVETAIASTRGDYCPWAIPVQGAERGTV